MNPVIPVNASFTHSMRPSMSVMRTPLVICRATRDSRAMVFWSSRRIRIVVQVSMSWPMVTRRGERNSMSASLKPPGLLASPTMPIIEPPCTTGRPR